MGRDRIYCTIVLLIIAVISCIFGFLSVAGLAASLAKILFFICLGLFLVSLIFTFTVIFKRR